MRRQLPLLVLFFSGMTMLVDYFFPETPLIHGTREVFLNWGRIALTFAMILGVMNLLISNLKKVFLQQSGWMYNMILLLSFGITFWYSVPFHFVKSGEYFSMIKGTDAGSTGFNIFMNVYTPLSSTMFSLVAFFIASAAFRAFRAKNIEATLLLGSAILVMLGSIPLGNSLYDRFHLATWFGSHNLSWVANFIQDVPMSASQRAINLGVAVGIISMSMKILLGIDRSYFGEGES